VTALVDGSVLIGIAVDDHEHHAAAAAWFESGRRPFATCPLTQGALVRHIVRNGEPASSALAFLDALCSLPTHEFWPDDLAYVAVAPDVMLGHRQVTDAYLAQLARRRSARLATFDRGLALIHPDVAELVPTA
jgi:hypothetical protein